MLAKEAVGNHNQNKQVDIKIDSWSVESGPAQEYGDKSGFGFTLGIVCQEGKGSAPFFVWFFVLLLPLAYFLVDESRR